MSPAEKLEAEDDSVDLVVCSQSMHWFNLDKFYPEVKRVLKPNGVLGATGYSNIPTISVSPTIAVSPTTTVTPTTTVSPTINVTPTTTVSEDEAGKELTNHLKTTYEHKYLRQYQVEKLKAIDNRYIDLDFPFEHFTRIEGINSFVDTSVEKLEGYIKTWSDFYRCHASEPESAIQVLQMFQKSVRKTAKDHSLSDDSNVRMTFHHFLIMGRKRD